jgi:outer membrane biosynthesis protein TonB
MMTNNENGTLLPFAISIILHATLLLLFFFSPSWLSRKFPEEQIIALEILPVTDKTNIKTQKSQKEKAITSEDSKKVNKTKQETQEPQKEVEKAQEAKKPEHKEITKDKIKPTKDTTKIPDKENKPIEKKKEEKNKLQKKQKNKEEAELESLLKTLEKASEGKNDKSKNQSRSEQTDAEKESKGPFDVESPISISEYQAIKQQIEKHWSVPTGGRDTKDIRVTLYIKLKPDGSVEQVRLTDSKCPIGSSALCQAVADTALRAVWLASPIQNLSQSRYDSWREFYIECDPSEIAG